MTVTFSSPSWKDHAPSKTAAGASKIMGSHLRQKALTLVGKVGRVKFDILR
ncbi:hypothetical protein [Chitinophaga japonensis]|uniref:hypothetical protein n=1 Tax=Chitinophaga japonensis TaxID=104662 RepID=UPI0031CE90AF